MTKEFGGCQFLRYRTAVYGNERFVATLAKLMNTVCHIFFTCSARTVDEYGHISRSYQAYIIVELLGSITFSFQIGTTSFCCLFG